MSKRLDTHLRKLVDLKREKDRTKTAADEAEKAFKAHQQIVFDEFEDLNQKGGSFDLGEGYGTISFTPRTTIRAYVFDEDRAFDAMEAAGLAPEMIKQAPRQAVLNEYVKTCLENGQTLPEGVGWKPTNYITQTRKRS